MAWSKLFSNFTWKNKSESKTTPLGATNLNAINTALDGIDDRLVDLTSDASEVGMIYAKGIRDDTGGRMEILSDDSLEIFADSDIDLVSDSGIVTYNGSEIARKSDLTNSLDISSYFTASSAAISEIEAYAIGNIVRLRMTVKPYGILNPSTWYDVLNISGYVPLSITAMEVAQGNTGNIPQTVSAILKNTGVVSLNIGTGTYTSGNYFILSSTYICS